jgi:hypothetical protein
MKQQMLGIMYQFHLAELLCQENQINYSSKW